MEATLKETKSSLEQLEKEHSVIKEIVHRITGRISTYLFPKDEETADNFQVDVVGQTVPDSSDLESTDNDKDDIMVITETPHQGVPELNNDTTNEQDTLPTKSFLEQLDKEHLALKEIVHQNTRRDDKLEENVPLIRTYLFPKDEETADNFQVDAVGQTVLDASDVDSTDNDNDDIMVIVETPHQGIPELNNDTTNEEDTVPVVGNRMQLTGLFGIRRWRENVRSPIKNTETLHMYTLSVTRKCATFPTLTGRVWSWFMSSFSLLLVISQMIVLLSLLFEGYQPTCTSHTDCSGGLFCDHNTSYVVQPRCVD